jgi:hypothetical protein
MAASCAVAVLQALRITDSKMQYRDLAKAIGLIPDGGKWEARHQQQIKGILRIVAAAERQKDGGKSTAIGPLEFERIITGKTGRPGKGVSKTSKIVTK